MTNRDVVWALSEGLDEHPDVERLRKAYEGAENSRFARLRTAWIAFAAALRGGGAIEPALRPPQAGAGRIGGPSSWRSAKNMPREYVEHLQARLGELSRALNAVRVTAVARTAERDAARSRAHAAEIEADRLRLIVDRERRSAREAAVAALSIAGWIPAPASASDTVAVPTPQHAHLAAALAAASEIFSASEPDVSVIIPAYNQRAMTLDCIASVVETAAGGPSIQLVVVDDGSPRESLAVALGDLPFVTVIRNGSNLGFLGSCNRGAQIATGRYLHFLNNDTLVQPGWLAALLDCAKSDDRIGAVGSKLIFADGMLQEAGGIIWSDASGWNYGRNDDAAAPQYNYVRDVDYCSGASLLVRSDVFRDIGGFSSRYAPAYYEDADLCFAIRARGMRVVYAPKSVVVHLEGASSGTSTDGGVKRNQLLNKPLFEAAWVDELQAAPLPDSISGLAAARRHQTGPTVLMVDSYVPEYDKDAGSLRIFSIIKLLREMNVNVIFAPDNYLRSAPYADVLQTLGVEVLYYTPGRPSVEEAFRERLALADIVWISRPDLAKRFMPIAREHSALPVVYDTVDLHHVRVRRELDLLGVDDPERWEAWESLRDLELGVIRQADVTVTVTDVERRLLEAEGIPRVCVVPTVHESNERVVPFEKTSGLLFIGGYAHPPNIDAVLWLCREILPIVWQRNPEIELTLIGSNPPASLSDLASDRVHVTGFVPQVEPYFERTRLFVAPLRFGAGMKGKIGQAFAHGVPTITTSIGAEGFDLVDGSDALIADDAAGIAAAIVRAYDDAALWHALAANAARVSRRFGPEATRDRLSALLAQFIPFP